MKNIPVDSLSVSGFIPTIAIAPTLGKESYSRIQESEWATPRCANMSKTSFITWT
ncbi:hypothetical protein [Nostoc sp. PCC 9305]|uniref:hypothetical protein n=1 Tax=Nostoc sp. PCC 9305 TaxID=296636 RepID=UPI0039C62DEF